MTCLQAASDRSMTLGKKLPTSASVGQQLQLVDKADRRGWMQQRADAFGDAVERVDLERELHAALGAELVHQDAGAGMTRDVFEQQRGSAGSPGGDGGHFGGAVGDLGHLEIRRDRLSDRVQFAGAVQPGDPFAKVLISQGRCSPCASFDPNRERAEMPRCLSLCSHSSLAARTFLIARCGMFEDSLLNSSSTGRSRTSWIVATSLGIQAALAAGIRSGSVDLSGRAAGDCLAADAYLDHVAEEARDQGSAKATDCSCVHNEFDCSSGPVRLRRAGARRKSGSASYHRQR